MADRTRKVPRTIKKNSTLKKRSSTIAQEVPPSKEISLHVLQQYDWDAASIKEVIIYLNSGKKVVPKPYDRRQRVRFLQKFAHHFVVRNNALVYAPLNLEAVPSDDDETAQKRRRTYLEKLFRTDEAIGKGQNNFHQLVLRHYLGIKRDHVISFLKTKPEYQLFQRKPRVVSRSAHPKYPLHYVAIDLLHISKKGYNLRNKLSDDSKEGKEYVFVAVDLFTNYSWFYYLKKADARSTKEAFGKLLKHNLSLRFPDDEDTRSQMEARDQLEYPVYVLSDGGSEFDGEFKTYLRDKGVKQIFRDSHSPQPHVEAVNNVLRNLMRAQFIRNKNKEWKKYINNGTFMRANNSNRDDNTGQYSDVLFESYMKAQGEAMRKSNRERKLILDEVVHVAKEKTAEREKKLKEKRSRAKRQRFEVGDSVRIKLATVQRSVRRKLKAHDGKSLVVRFSADVYTVDKVMGKDPMGLHMYFLRDKNGNHVKTPDDKRKMFKGSELLKVLPNKDGVFEEYLTQQQVNKLNGVSEEDIVEEVEPSAPVQIKERTIKNILEDPFGKWRIQHWRKALIGNEFEDEGARWRITDVSAKYRSQGYYHTYNVHYVDKDGEETFTYLPWLFSEKFPGVKREEWFQRRKEDYESLADPGYRDETRKETFQVGDVVYAWWWKQKMRAIKYKAKVKKVNADGTYDILYDNEKAVETRVPSTYMAKEDNEQSAKAGKNTRRQAVSRSGKMTLRGKRKI